MSQIGNEKGGLEMIGRLLGGVDGKAGRVATKLGGGASQDFARLMASAQGRLNGGQVPSSTAGEGAKGGAVLPDQLRSALNALGEEMARLRQRLASDASASAALGERGQDLQATLEQMAEALSPAGQQGAGQKHPGDGMSASHRDADRNGRVPVQAQSDPTQTPGAGDSRSAVAATLESDDLADKAGGVSSSQGAPRPNALGRLSSDETFAREVADLAEALADWRQALDEGAVARTEAATDALRDRLAGLRESMQDGALVAGEQSPGLIGQLQALQQLMARAETARSGEAPAARAGAEPRGWSEWSWRLAGGGQQASTRSGIASTAFAAAAPVGDDADWSGGPVTAALGLAGREMPAQARSERLTPTHWSALGGPSAQSADAATEAMTSASALGQAASASSSLSSGSASGGIFTGQAATPPPNPQMPAQLGQQIQWMVGKGVSRANIELRPADLGPLKISIETQGDETRIALTATNATTQGLLEQQLPRLKEWLQESGLAQSEVDVSLADEGDFGQQLADTDGEESGDQSGLTGDGEALASAGGAAEDAETAEWVDAQGVLDLFA
ncbi:MULTISPECIES: flagellar hook-length control protein FliK [unclassified Guyparkeria]|uniref:flagellar hook-length control protein FliK n=1 Tax=unclassified Guyparkeria TaxID=2626246 RepID=UPI0007334CBC|nr:MULTISPECIES: flagellar hook-length control protein FliK [unclassified Guyparkeria]KTG17342.1 hypothetical protein AUR63_09325 [Guyparkeria sp. XI15]OAE87319.1 hypothetical protein AWR35_09345 [Guyparkeria sp. WRN-7]